MNDLVGIKKKHGNKLVICGGLDNRLFHPHNEVTEEECRSAVRTLMDNLAPGGGFAFLYSRAADPTLQNRSDWVNDEYEKLKDKYYS
jgi:hypothetical protein